MTPPPRRSLCAALAVLAASGCSSALERQQLESVAKDWALTIRASQVIPVYPLTEDLEPGDLFLVTKPVQTQADAYQEKGFLPLDQYLGRLSGLALEYREHYEGFGIGDDDRIPRNWQAAPPIPPMAPPTDEGPPPTEETAASEPVAEAGAPEAHRDPTRWSEAPRAAFPSYSFEVDTSKGLSLAIPVNGIPIALSMVRADRATGTVSITDAYTYGLPLDRLYAKVTEWSEYAPVRQRLRELVELIDADEGAPPSVFVRLVSRVYLTGGVLVNVTNAASTGAAGGAGAQSQLDIPDLDGKPAGQTAAKNYSETLEKLSATVSDSLPGGQLQVNWATNRSVSMSETFDRPLVIGYLGFDFPVRENGSLGVPIATLDQLERGAQATRFSLELTETEVDYAVVQRFVDVLDLDTRTRIYDDAAAMVGGEFLSIYTAKRRDEPEPEAPADAFASAKMRYTLEVRDSAERIHRALIDAARPYVNL